MSTLLRTASVLLLLALASNLLAVPAAAQATFTVTSVADQQDPNPGDGVCETASNTCTLRAAIQEANAVPNAGAGPDEIRFDLSGSGPHEIQPQTELPALTEAVVIDGTTEPDHAGTPAIDAPVVEIDGQNTTGASGLVIEAADVRIEGLSLTGFDGKGIKVDAPEAVIGENYIGVAPDGTADGNDLEGIAVQGQDTRIGDDGSNGTDGNVISANGNFGIGFVDTGSVIVGNRIGTTPDGLGELGNAESGIQIAFGSSITIGGPARDQRNVISGNGASGIRTAGSSLTISNNYIGIGADGTTGLGNEKDGVRLRNGATATVIGPHNVISGNDRAGIRLTDSNGNGTTNNTVEGNFIGTNAPGTAAVANAEDGVVIQDDASDNQVGGLSASTRNVIAGNERNGVSLLSGAEDNAVVGNYIGTNASGTGAVPNETGVDIAFGASINNSIGGPQDGAGNLVSGNEFDGILINNSAGPNTVQGNRVGLDADGNALGNGSAGIDIDNSSQTTVGGTSTGSGNTVAYNGDSGVVVTFSNRGVGNRIRSNAVFANEAPGIDLGNDDRTINDPGDSDDGANRLQNYPEIQDADYDPDANVVTAIYLVPSDPAASGSGTSAYPLSIDFYKAGAGGEQGKAHLGTDTYSASDYSSACGSPPCAKRVRFTPTAPVTRSDAVVATATDDDGNTSEFSAASEPLPVELAGFEARQAGDESVRLTWTTTSEQGNAGFRIQQRADESGAWTQIGFVDSKAERGTATETLSYRFTADDLQIGTHTFRLEQVDLDGSTHIHGPVTIDVQMRKTLRLNPPAPNPIRHHGTVSFAVKEQQEATLRLFNVLGQEVASVYRGTPTAGEMQTARLNAGDLSSGVYFLRLTAGTQSTTRRVTVVK